MPFYIRSIPSATVLPVLFLCFYFLFFKLERFECRMLIGKILKIRSVLNITQHASIWMHKCLHGTASCLLQGLGFPQGFRRLLSFLESLHSTLVQLFASCCRDLGQNPCLGVSDLATSRSFQHFCVLETNKATGQTRAAERSGRLPRPRLTCHWLVLMLLEHLRSKGRST